MTTKTKETIWRKELGHDLPDGAIITRPDEKNLIRPFRWRCTNCGMSQGRVDQESAFEWAWDHVVGDLPCDGIKGETR